MDNQPSMGDQFLAMVNKIIDENLADENFSVEDLANKAGLSRSMLHRKLIKLTGKSATDLIMEKRLIRAKELLENDAATTSEIAYKVGFGSPSYFHKVFKKHFNVSPGEIRKGTAVHTQRFQPFNKNKIQALTVLKTSPFITYSLLILFATVIVTGSILLLSKTKKPTDKSIAILPFDNLSPDEENRYFADGMVEDLLNRLCLIKDLKVISRTSSEMFRDRGNKSIPEIARILDVGYILEGSVRREAGNIRISVQLIDAKNDNHIYSKQYDRNIGETFKIQGEIAGQIANELSVYLSDNHLSEMKRNQTDNLEAFNYYQMGLYHYQIGRRNDTYASVEYFRKAIRADSNYALAYAGLAHAYYNMIYMGRFWIEGLESGEDMESGKDSTIKLAMKALEKDERLAEAHVILGRYYREFEYNYKAAEKEFLKAIELNPNYAQSYNAYAGLLNMTGLPEKVREYMDKAIILDPLSFDIRFSSAMLYLNERNYQKALEETNICLELVPDQYWALEFKFFSYMGLGNEKAAYESLRKVGSLYRAQFHDPTTAGYTVEQADSAFRVSGMEGFIRFHIQKMGGHSRSAQFYTVLGEHEKAIEMLELFYNQGDMRPNIFTTFDYRDLEPYPRFKALKKKFGLEKY
ncbi:MAG: helix-turn-helix domain-containing protein [Bacteroidales bacterium]|nr:helix-turn-helix domain-containing protein [Bacteroidales bacterium]